MPGPHDLFARYTFSHPERAAVELRSALPARIVEQVDWSTLRLEPSSVVDEELRETESDLLFSATLRTGRPMLVYILLEHQSTVDRWMALRMLHYVVRTLDVWRKEHPESELLPVVLSQVMYHGVDGAWTAPRRVEELFDLPSAEEAREPWCAWVPRFEYLLDDLTAEREEVLRARTGPPLVQLAYLVLRYGRTEELVEHLPRWQELFAQVFAAPEGEGALRVVARYLIEVGSKAVGEVMWGVLRSALDSQQAEEVMKTWREEYIEQGHQLGWKKGRAEGLAEGQAKGLAEGQAKGLAEAVLRILGARGVSVGDTIRHRIVSCTDVKALEHWLERALTATNASDIMEDG
jgi:predicted transposase YdaD